MNKYGLQDSFDRAKQLIDVAEEMQVILTDFYVNGWWRTTDDEKDALYVKVGKALDKYDAAYGTWI
jgi:hypothetical protein